MLKARGKIDRNGIQVNAKIQPAIKVFRKDGFISQTCVVCGEDEPIIVGCTMVKSKDGGIEQRCIEDFNEPKN